MQQQEISEEEASREMLEIAKILSSLGEIMGKVEEFYTGEEFDE